MAKLTVLQVKFLVWLNLSPNERAQKTQRELAVALGVHFNTLQLWQKMPGWDDLVQKAGWYVIEQTNNQALIKARELVQSSEDLKSLSDYFRWIYPLAAKARTSGYFDELEPNKQQQGYLPEEIVQQEVSKLPVNEQMNVVNILQKLDYLKSEQVIIDTEQVADVMSDLMIPVEERPTVYRNTSKRKSSKFSREVKALPSPATSPIKRKRHYSSNAAKNVEL